VINLDNKSKIYVAGHRGMVGSAILRLLESEGYENIVTATSKEVDLRDSLQVKKFFEKIVPEYIFLAAAKVGGIQANSKYPANFLYDNLMIQSNVIHNSYRFKVKKLLFLGSSCVYPKECPQPMKEESLMTGPLEPTNEAYAIAKIAGLKMAQYYYQQYGVQIICPMPCNIYGPKDSFDPENSHVLSALIKKFVDAVDEDKKEVVLWGTGVARREFLHVEDAAKACLYLMKMWDSPEIINVGSGKDISIKDLAMMIAQKVRYNGKIKWDTTMPDGMLRKCLDISKLNSLGFKSSISLEHGIDLQIEEYRHFKDKRV
jgi:GDP-L-fucose synthase